MLRPRVRLVGLHTVGPGGKRIVPSPEGLTETKVLRSPARVLDETPLCSLATVAPCGAAHGAHVYFAYAPDFELYFLSHPDSVHCRHLRANPTVAISVYDSRQRWGGWDCGVALEGACRGARGKEAARAEEAYRRRFPPYREWRASLEPGDPALGWRFHRFAPARIKVLDEAVLGGGVFAIASLRRQARVPPPKAR